MKETKELKKAAIATKEVPKNEPLESDKAETPEVQVARMLNNRRDSSQLSLTPSNVIALQRTIGNKAVQRMIAAQHKPIAIINRDWVDSTTPGKPSTKSYERGTQTSTTDTTVLGFQNTNNIDKNTSEVTTTGLKQANTTSTVDTTGNKTQSTTTQIGYDDLTTYKDPNDSTHSIKNDKFTGITTTSSQTTENNTRDVSYLRSNAVGGSIGTMDKTTESQGTGSNAKTKTTENFSGAEGNANFSTKADLNSLNVKGGVDGFAGHREKVSQSQGTANTATQGNQAQVGLDIAESIIGDKEFVVNTLGIKGAEKLYKEKKDKDTKKTYGTQTKKDEVNKGEGAEILYKLKKEFDKAIEEQDPQKRHELIQKINEDFTGDSGKRLKPAARVVEAYGVDKVPQLYRWIYSGDPTIALDVLAGEIDAVVKGSGLVTSSGKSKSVTTHSTMLGAQSENSYNYKTTPVSAQGGFKTDNKLGYYRKDENVKRGDAGPKGYEYESTTANELMVGARGQSSGTAKIGISGINLGLDASAMLGVQDTLTNNSAYGNEKAGNKLENKFKAQGTAGASGDFKGKAALNAQGINLSMDASAMAGLEGVLEDAVEITYQNHKIFSLKGTLRGNLGVGARASGKFSMGSNGNLIISFEAGFTLGIGGSAGFEIEVNFKEIGALIVTKIVDALKSLWNWIKGLFGKKDEPKKDPTAPKQEVAKDITDVDDKVATIPSKLARAQSFTEGMGDKRTASVIQGVSNTARRFSVDLAKTTKKVEKLEQEKPTSKAQEKEHEKVQKEVKKEVKQEALEAQQALKDLAGK